MCWWHHPEGGRREEGFLPFFFFPPSLNSRSKQQQTASERKGGRADGRGREGAMLPLKGATARGVAGERGRETKRRADMKHRKMNSEQHADTLRARTTLQYVFVKTGVHYLLRRRVINFAAFAYGVCGIRRPTE